MYKLRKYTVEQIEYIKTLAPTTTRAKISKMVNKKYNLNTNTKAIKNICTKYGFKSLTNSGCFKKGLIPWNKGTVGVCKPNKTSFKKGQAPITQKPVGAISYRWSKREGKHYMYIKLANGKWRTLGEYIWESINGKIPKDHCIIFKDKNPKNTSLDNLMLIKRSELVKLNGEFSGVEPELKDSALNIIKLRALSKEKRREYGN